MEEGTLRARLVSLHPIKPEEVRRVYESVLNTGMEALPTLDALEAHFETGADKKSQIIFTIELRATRETIGIGTFESVGIGTQWKPEEAERVSVGILMDPDRTPPAAGGEATELLMRHVFERLPKARIAYCITTDASVRRLGGLLTKLPCELTQRDERYFRGRLWDTYWYPVQRSWWLRQKPSATHDSAHRTGTSRWSRRPLRSTS